jgi:lysophospholipase L1-like esterase
MRGLLLALLLLAGPAMAQPAAPPGLKRAANGSDLLSPSTFRANLGLGPTAIDRYPTATDDSAHGYHIASATTLADIWLDPSGGMWQIIRDTPGYAVWSKLGISQPGDLVAPAAAYATKRIITGFAGALFQLRRASDSTTTDIAQLASGDPDTAAMQSFCQGTTCSYSSLYDQTGGAKTLTVPAATGTIGGVAYLTAEPAMTFENTIGNVPSITLNTVTPLAGPPKTYSILSNTALALTTNPLTIVSVAKFPSSEFSAGIVRVGSPITATLNLVDLGYQESTNSFSASINSGGSTVFRSLGSTARPTMQAAVYGMANASTLVSLFHGNRTTAFATSAQTGSATAGIVLGGATNVGGLGYNEIAAIMVYSSALTATQFATVRASLAGKFQIQTQLKNVLVADGDSITWGQGSTYLHGWAQRLVDTSPNAMVYNVAHSGDVIEDRIAAFDTLIAPLAQSGQKNGVLLMIGTNNVGPSTKQATGLYAQTAATIYPLITSYVAHAHTLGFRVCVSTMTARDITLQTSPQITEFAALNGLIRANAAGADCVADINADPEMGSTVLAQSRVLWNDGVHPNDAGYQRVVMDWLTSIVTLLQ